MMINGLTQETTSLALISNEGGNAGPIIVVSSVNKSLVDFSGGSSVVITGSGFTGASTVKFGSTNAASFTIDSDTQITATTPAKTASATPVSVSVGSGSLAACIEFFAPTNISNCVQWLRADLGITTSAGRTTIWADQSGQSFDMTSAYSAINHPPLAPSTWINSKPAITWTQADNADSGDRLDNGSPPAALTGATEVEGFVIGQVSSFGITVGVGLWNYGSGGAGWFPYIDGNDYENFCSASRPAGTGAVGVYTVPWIYNIQNSLSNFIGTLNGTSIMAYPSSLGISIQNPCTIGSATLAGFDGQIAEVAIYARILTSGERIRVNAYNKDRYGFPHSPNTFSGIVGWWSADVGITQSSGSVSLVADQSGNGNDLSASGSAKPTLVSNTLNGLPVISFDGVANELRKTAASIGGAGDMTLTMVVRKNVASGSAYPGLFLLGDWSSSHSSGAIFIAGSDEVFAVRDLNNGASAIDLTAKGFVLVSLAIRASGSPANTLWLNGAPTNDNSISQAIVTTGDLIIGNRAGQFAEIDLAEAILYNADQTTNRQEIEMYLRQKYNL